MSDGDLIEGPGGLREGPWSEPAVELSMKPMLAELVVRAVRLALIDSTAEQEHGAFCGLCTSPLAWSPDLAGSGDLQGVCPEHGPVWDTEDDVSRGVAVVDGVRPWMQRTRWKTWSDDQRAVFLADIHQLPGDALAAMSPMALALNVACRLLGTGGWTLPDFQGVLYAGNASSEEVFRATFHGDSGRRSIPVPRSIRLDSVGDGVTSWPVNPPLKLLAGDVVHAELPGVEGKPGRIAWVTRNGVTMSVEEAYAQQPAGEPDPDD